MAVFGVLGLVLNVRGSGVLRVLRIMFRAVRVLRMAKLFSRRRALAPVSNATVLEASTASLAVKST